MATIRDVAREAGVSTATVSRVLSRPELVNAETRASVVAAVETLGYTPNAAAKSLRTLRSGKLLVTVPDIANPFFALILQGIESAALRAGYSVLLGDTQHDDKREQQYALMLQRREADGLIFLGHRLPKAAAGLVRSLPARPGAGRQRLRVQPQPGRAERAHRQRQGGVRGGGPPVPARTPPHRRRHRADGEPAQPRSPEGGDGAGEPGPGAASRCGRRRRLLDRVGHRGRRAAAGRRQAADRHLLLQRRDGDRRAARRAAARHARARRSVGGRLRRHPLRAVPSTRRSPPSASRCASSAKPPCGCCSTSCAAT